MATLRGVPDDPWAQGATDLRTEDREWQSRPQKIYEARKYKKSGASRPSRADARPPKNASTRRRAGADQSPQFG
jgi:hypothetical protein